jgi:hypothetical protein
MTIVSSLSQITKNAIVAAKRDGYNQVVMACADGTYSFVREANGKPVTSVFKNERAIGRVVVFWERGHIQAKFVSR